MECRNCSAADGGRPRTLVVESERELELSLCETCYRAFVAEEWVEAPEQPPR